MDLNDFLAVSLLFYALVAYLAVRKEFISSKMYYVCMGAVALLIIFCVKPMV